MQEHDPRLSNPEVQEHTFTPLIDVSRKEIADVINGQSSYVGGYGGFIRQENLGLEITNMIDPSEQVHSAKESEPILRSGDLSVDLRNAMVSVRSKDVTFVKPASYNGVHYTYSWVTITSESVDYHVKTGDMSAKSAKEPITQAAQLARRQALSNTDGAAS